MREKKFHFQQYFLILIFLLIIVSFLTYLYSSKIIDESKNNTEENVNLKLKLLNIEDFYFDLNSSFNMDDFFFPKPSLPDGKLGDSVMHYRTINEDILQDLWVKSDNLFNIDLEKENELLVDKILENYK